MPRHDSSRGKSPTRKRRKELASKRELWIRKKVGDATKPYARNSNSN